MLDNTPRRRIAGAVALAAGLVGLLAASPAAAATIRPDSNPACHGPSCYGLDPKTTGCSNDAYTAASFDLPGGWATVELRYSPSCAANWATVSVHEIYPDSGEFWVQNTLASNSEQSYGVDGLSYLNPTSWWTNMVDGVPSARACIVTNNYYSFANPGCTSWE